MRESPPLDTLTVARPDTEARTLATWRSPRFALWLAGILTVVTLAIVGVHAYREWTSSLAQGAARVNAMAKLFAEHTGRLLDGADFAAREVAGIFSEHGGRWDDVAASEADFRRLVQLVGVSDQLVALWLTDAQGMPRLTSRGFPAPAIDTSDREHFRVQREADQGAFVSRLLRSRVDDTTNIVLSRRLSGPAGEFRGIVQSVVRPDRLANAYRGLEPGEGAEFMLFRRDGAMILRYPPLPDEVLLAAWRTNMPASAPSAGALRVTSPFDGRERLEAAAAVEPYSVVVSFGLPVATLLDGWRSHVTLLGVATAIGLAAVWVVAWLVVRQARGELAAREALEAHVATRTEELASALKQRDTLLIEVNHRIKNNLQLVGSLLALQMQRQTNEDARRALGEARTRVAAIADLHKHLYLADRTTAVRIDAYLTELCRDLSASIGGGTEDRYDLSCAGDAVMLPLDQAIPLALIATELVTNATKYAFPEGRKGRIEVRVRRSPAGLRLSVRDDGVGMAASTVAELSSSAAPTAGREMARGGLGTTLVRALTRQLQGTLRHEAAERGTCIVVDIPTAALQPAG